MAILDPFGMPVNPADLVPEPPKCVLCGLPLNGEGGLAHRGCSDAELADFYSDPDILAHLQQLDAASRE